MEGLPIADELDEIRNNEEENYQISVGLLGESVTLVQDLLELYRLLAESAGKSELARRDEYITRLYFLLAARYHLTSGTLAILRTHTTDGLRSGRMAIEAAAFAARVKRQPELAMAWLNAAKDDEAYERYHRLFSGGKLFPEGDDLLQKMSERFDVTSQLSHSRMDRRPPNTDEPLPPTLTKYIPQGHHADLRRRAARWRARGVSLDAVAVVVGRVADLEDTLGKRRPGWAREAKGLRNLRRRLKADLEQVLATYEKDPRHSGNGTHISAILRFPIRGHARAILEYLEAAERARRGAGKAGDPTIDFADPMVPPIPLRRGPSGFTALFREELAGLGLSRQDTAWLMQRAVAPRS